jgi:uncharacterized membrane protein YccC
MPWFGRDRDLEFEFARLYARLHQQENRIMAAIDDLRAEVAVAVTDIKAAIDRLAAGGTSEADIAAVTANLKASTDALEAALNPVPPPPPVSA